MMRQKLGVKNALELDGISACLNKGTTTEANINDFFQSRGMQFTLEVFREIRRCPGSVSRRDICDVYTADHSALHAQRSRLKTPRRAHDPACHHFERAARTGGPAWRRSVVRDRQMDTVRIDQCRGTRRHRIANALKLSRESKTPAIRRLLGSRGRDRKETRVLIAKWAFRAIRQVGNYDEDVRTQSRRQVVAQDRSRHQRIVDDAAAYSMRLLFDKRYCGCRRPIDDRPTWRRHRRRVDRPDQ